MQNYPLFFKKHTKFYLTVISFSLTGVIWLIYNFFVGHNFILCPTKSIFGLPCPGCGLTRSFISFFNGDFCEALYYNINIIIILPVLVFLFFSMLYDIITSRTFTYNIYIIINQKINNKRFLILFILFELLIEIHHIINNI